METLPDEAMRRNGTCLRRPAPQSERGLKENEIIKARADQIKTACAKIRNVPQPRHKHREGTTKRHESSASNGPGASYGGIPPKKRL